MFISKYYNEFESEMWTKFKIKKRIFVPASGWFESLNIIRLETDNKYPDLSFKPETSRFGLLNSVDPELINEYDKYYKSYLVELKNKKKELEYKQLFEHPDIKKFNSILEPYFEHDYGDYNFYGEKKWKRAFLYAMVMIKELIEYEKETIEELLPVISIMVNQYPEKLK